MGWCGVGIHRLAGGPVLVWGVFKKQSTIEEFKAQVADEVWSPVPARLRHDQDISSAAQRRDRMSGLLTIRFPPTPISHLCRHSARATNTHVCFPDDRPSTR
ncbi:hypothetical protein AcV5_002261 [Taiwanofungus camphoratus]|nr:hypothetical protein AcV5_002261 [Antrodia cinnamomea]KAI0944145.1 hypothetical protein AcV7_002051 [Antrodia cinnamomea]